METTTSRLPEISSALMPTEPPSPKYTELEYYKTYLEKACLVPQNNKNIVDIFRAQISGSKNKELVEKMNQLNAKQIMGMLYLRSLRTQNIVKRFSLLITFDGRHRSGKSVQACLLGYLLDNTFAEDFKNRVVQTPQEFLDKLSEFEKKKIKGGCIVIDEAGVSMSSDDWYEKWMKVLNKVIQMFGFLLPIIIFVSPDKSLISSKIRRMFHLYGSVKRSDNDSTRIRFYNIVPNLIKGKPYYSKPTVRAANQYYTIREISFSRPPEWFLKMYQDIEDERKPKMFQELKQELEQTKRSELKRTSDPEAFASELANLSPEERAGLVLKETRDGTIKFDVELISFKYKLKPRDARLVSTLAEQKLNAVVKEKKQIYEKLEKPKPLTRYDYNKLAKKVDGSVDL